MRVPAIAAIFVAGVCAGAILMYVNTGDQSDGPGPSASPEIRADGTAAPVPNPFRAVESGVGRTDDDNDDTAHARMQQIERQIEELSLRLAVLEQQSQQMSGPASGAAQTPSAAVPGVTIPSTALDALLTTDNLVKAGIDPGRAGEIIARRNDVDFSKLELQDRATREGWMGSARYLEELAEIDAGNVDLRQELGDDLYDRFLYAAGQRNRVTAASVMRGSPAEQAGMASGDVIYAYDGRRLFDWNELKSATAEGERGEFVNVTVLREGQQLTLWVPRGPLGVRLGTTRLQPGI